MKKHYFLAVRSLSVVSFLKVSCFACLIGVTNALFPGEPLVINGFGSLIGQTVSGDVTINGAATVEKSSISGELNVNGSLNVTSSSIKKVMVNGAFTGKEVTITAPSQIQGSFEGANSKFDDLEISSRFVVLDTCVARNIVLSKMNHDDQIIEIKGDSKIESITFESKGVVKKTSKVVIKTIKNATIENLN